VNEVLDFHEISSPAAQTIVDSSGEHLLSEFRGIPQEGRWALRSRLLDLLRTAVEQRLSRELESDIFELSKPLTPEEELEARRSELRKGLTDMQRLFLFGKFSGLNDKDAALAAGYSVSVAENTKQRIWKPRVRAEFERLQRGRP
jgi:hypothetical protein